MVATNVSDTHSHRLCLQHTSWHLDISKWKKRWVVLLIHSCQVYSMFTFFCGMFTVFRSNLDEENVNFALKKNEFFLYLSSLRNRIVLFLSWHSWHLDISRWKKKWVVMLIYSCLVQCMFTFFLVMFVVFQLNLDQDHVNFALKKNVILPLSGPGFS